MRTVKVILTLLVLACLLAGCGSVHAGPSSSPAAASPTRTTLGGPTIWRAFPAEEVESMRLSDSGRLLVIAVQVPPRNSTCLRDFTARLMAFGSALAYVTISFEEPVAGPAMYECPLGPIATVRIALPAPLGHRQVVLDRQETFWSASTTTLTLCSDAGSACQHVSPWPPPASCSDVSYSWAMLATAPPQHAVYSELGCDGRWLVLDVGWPGGPSGCDGPSCHPDMTTTHWFFRASKHGWIVVATSLTAGCTRVRQEEPQFPTALCARLPKVGP